MPCNHAVRLLLASALRPTTTLVEAKEMKGSTLQEDHKSQVTNVGETAPLKTGPAFLFDLDGTLVDSVYQHVLAWQEALGKMGIELAVWRIHRRGCMPRRMCALRLRFALFPALQSSWHSCQTPVCLGPSRQAVEWKVPDPCWNCYEWGLKR